MQKTPKQFVFENDFWLQSDFTRHSCESVISTCDFVRHVGCDALHRLEKLGRFDKTTGGCGLNMLVNQLFFALPINKSMIQKTYRQTDRPKEGWTEGRMDGRKDRWRNGQTDGRLDAGMDRQSDRLSYIRNNDAKF